LTALYFVGGEIPPSGLKVEGRHPLCWCPRWGHWLALHFGCSRTPSSVAR